jgi:uroporphyrinogen decarboxylase
VDKVPNIGFAGAPFTVAMYMVEGGPSARFHKARMMMFEAPEIFEALVAKVAEMTTGYVLGQVRHGVDAMIMFDSLAKMVSKEEYDRFALPYAKKTFEAVKATGVPTLYYVNGFTSLASSIKEVGVDVYGLDWRTPIDQILHVMGNDIVIQGNLDPYALFASDALMRQRVQLILDQASRARSHVFNLGEGIMPETPVAKARAMVDAVHELSRK